MSNSHLPDAIQQALAPFAPLTSADRQLAAMFSGPAEAFRQLDAQIQERGESFYREVDAQCQARKDTDAQRIERERDLMWEQQAAQERRA